MPKPFIYRERTQAQIQYRANKQGGDFQGFVRDEFRMFRPQKGENIVRILPATWDGSEHYGLDVFVHYRIGPENASVLCLRRMLKEPCPICEAMPEMERMGEDTKEISPRRQILTWIIDRKKEQDGPMLWSIPPSLDQDIQKHSQDRRTGQYYVIDHPEEGYDVYFDKTGEGLLTRYEGVSIARDPTSVDQEYLDWIADNPVPETLMWRDYDEVAGMFSGGVGPARRGNGAGSPRREPPPSQRSQPSSTARREPPAAESGGRRSPAVGPSGGGGKWSAPVSPRRSAPPPVEEEPPYENGEDEEEAPPRRTAPPSPRRTPPPADVTPIDKSRELRDKFANRGR